LERSRKAWRRATRPDECRNNSVSENNESAPLAIGWKGSPGFCPVNAGRALVAGGNSST
jgi:hypothetical protein